MELICLCLAVWLCLKMGSKNMVLVWLLQIGAKDLTVGYINAIVAIQSIHTLGFIHRLAVTV